jgi:hypothetical protein
MLESYKGLHVKADINVLPLESSSMIIFITTRHNLTSDAGIDKANWQSTARLLGLEVTSPVQQADEQTRRRNIDRGCALPCSDHYVSPSTRCVLPV